MNVLIARALLAATLVASLSSGNAAFAQQSLEPVAIDDSISPQPMTLEAPQTLEPPASDGESQTQDQPSSNVLKAPADGSIQVNVLDEIDIDSAGPLSLQDGGLGPSAWQAASMPEVTDLLEDLPTPIASDALRDLTTRLLASGAPAPIKLDRVGTNEGDFVLQRLSTLSTIGAFDEMERLLAVVPGGDSDPRFLRWATIASLLREDVAGACGRASIGTRESDDPFWQQLLVVCQAFAGQASAAELGLSLMRDLGQVGPTYDRLVSSIIYEQPAVLERPPRADPLLQILFNRAGATLDEDAMSSLASMPVDSLQHMLVAPHLDEETRITIAELLASNAAVSGHAIRELLGGISFTEEQSASPLTAAGGLDAIRALALLYQTSVTQQIDTAKAEAVAAAITRARDEGLFEATARAFVPVVQSIPARADLVWFAEDAARILIMTGDADAARGWVAIIRSAALLDAQVANAQVRLSPLMHLAGLGQRPFLVEEMEAWLQSVSDQPQGRERAAVVFTLLDAIEPGASTPLWPLMGGRAGTRGGVGADLAIWHRLANASLAEAPGLTVLLAVHLVGRSSLTEADPLVMQHVIRGLVNVGLVAEARSLALEMAVTRGL